MSANFALIFWGLLLVFLNFRIDHVDILPDFVGYILVAVGCSRLSGASRCFPTARSLSCVLVLFDVLSYALSGSAATSFNLLERIVHCTMMWFLLGGLMELAQAQHRTDLSDRASRYRAAYVVAMCLATLAGLLAQSSRYSVGEVGTVLAICILAALFLVLFLIFHLIYRFKHEVGKGYVA